MCRYAWQGPYKSHYACFSCRKAFKQPPIEDYLEVRGCGYVYKQLRYLCSNDSVLKLREDELGHRRTDLEEEYRNATHRCPECGDHMIDMGLDFKPPKQSDAKAWKTFHGMFRVGHAFHTCGCDGPGWIPRSKSDYLVYLARQKQRYEVELEKVLKCSGIAAEAKQEAAEYWTRRIAVVDHEQLSAK